MKTRDVFWDFELDRRILAASRRTALFEESARREDLLAQDLGPFDINVNCIAPGLIATGRIARAQMA